MKIILSPTKKMKTDNDTFLAEDLPVFIDQSEEILSWLRTLSEAELKKLWNCNDKIVKQNIERIQTMNLRKNLTPALFAYEGIAYQHMSPQVFEHSQIDYVKKHLRILSAFYGVLRPMDGVCSYRLEMQAKASINNHKDLYDLWGNRLYDALKDDDGIIINLASKEYSKCIEKYLTSDNRYISVTFCEKSGDKLVSKGTYAKMARGEMVRYMAEKNIQKPEQLYDFNSMGYHFREDLSSDSEYVFERKP